ncbi:MAG: sulfurtransferase [Anaerolineae bacterium]
MYSTLIDAKTLAENLNDPAWVIVDCRFSLANTEAGAAAYRESHVPGAVYAHLDHDLSGVSATDSGRHPLPTPGGMAALFSRLGISERSQVVAYDGANGMVAARLWWMLRFMGHTAVAVLDGGWQAWTAADLPARAGVEQNDPVIFTGSPRMDRLVQLEDVVDVELLVDSRAPARYRGEEEPIDPVAGHIPGAVNHFYQQNWTTDGRYLKPEEIRPLFKSLLGRTTASKAVFYCGSGVSACVNLLAMVHAGLEEGCLYVGSWSEWSRDPGRPIALGDT